jgi:hypothetical protein
MVVFTSPKPGPPKPVRTYYYDRLDGQYWYLAPYYVARYT